MKCAIFAVALILLVSVTADEKYSSKFMNVDLDEVLKNDRLIDSYFKCLLDGEGCTPEGEELSKILPDAIQTGCEKCTDEQKEGGKKVAAFLMKEKPEMWEKLVAKYDPDNVYRTKYQEEIKAAGFDV